MRLDGRRARSRAEPSPKRRVVGEPPERGGEVVDVARRDEERRHVVVKHVCDLAESARDDRLPRRHVLEELRRRAEELDAAGNLHVWGGDDVAGVQVGRDRRRRQPRPASTTRSATPPSRRIGLDLGALGAVADEQQPTASFAG